VTSGIKGNDPILVSQPTRRVFPLASVTGESMKQYDLLSGSSEIESRKSNITTLPGQP
jgi:hypothetical protein